MRGFRAATFAALALLGLSLTAPLRGQTGFSQAGWERQRGIEAAVLAAIRPAELDSMAAVLSTAPHVAGTPGQTAFRDTLVAWLGGWGLGPRVESYRVFLPHATAVELTLVAPDSIEFHLREDPLPADPPTTHPQYPWANGYSAPGVAEGEVIYANYGLHEDYTRLDSLGVSVEGRVVVARYGRAYRGVKARLAEEHGAAALLLYSDPDDDGYVKGDVYPEGPYRPWSGVQRGSILDGVGDPSTPDGPSVASAPRADSVDLADALPAIPVLPVSYAVASEILSRVGRADLPQETWQGGLPFRYHVGPGPALVRVRVDDDRDGPDRGMKLIHDVVTRVEGSQWPGEIVVLGAHIDAWGPGANDNASGTVSMLAAARAIGRLAEEGRPPRRTIVFAGWDGEEWGLIGSTEWVEEHASRLAEGGVGYINQDAIGGRRFRAAAAPSLRTLLHESARAVIGNGGTLYHEWQGEDAAEPEIGDLGGGSDFAPFYQHLGIPSTSHGFGSPGGAYHSTYDTHRWMQLFGDPGYENHARSARLAAILALRLANADVLPYDPTALAARLDSLWAPLRAMVVSETGSEPSLLNSVDSALRRLAEAGQDFLAVRDRYLVGDIDSLRTRRANAELIAMARSLTRASGLAHNPWYRNLTFASDPRNGYATLAFPGVSTAIRAADPERVEQETADLARGLEAAAAPVRRASAALEGRSPGAP